MTTNEIFGSMDSFGAFKDGIATEIFRNMSAKQNSLDDFFLLFDGPVDYTWVESLNTVLDDNKVLPLPTAERINLNDNMRVLFETQDLSCAAPSTISRVGMIYMQSEE